MQITSKGQVTIPIHIRNSMGLKPHTEVQFSIENGKVILQPRPISDRFKTLKGAEKGRFTTQEIMELTRG